MAMRNIVAQLMIQDVLTDLMVRTNSTNVVLEFNEDGSVKETLATRLASIAATLATLDTADSVDSKISTAIANLIDGAPETYDTLKEISDYISSDSTAMDALNAAIGTKVSKEEGKGLSANDFTDILKAKLDAISEGATKVENSDINGNIKVDDNEVTVYTHPTTDGNVHLPAGGEVGQMLVNKAAGTAEWVTPTYYVQSGAAAPETLKANELFIKLV